MTILVAGIGNIFDGDDAFGVETARRLLQRRWPQQVKIVDFGIRGIDLVYALIDHAGDVILIDAAQRGEPPGTVSLIEIPAPEIMAETAPDLLEPHALDPAKVLRLAASLGGKQQRALLVACEPLTLGGDEGIMGLSEPVAAAIDPACELVDQLVRELSNEDKHGNRDIGSASNFPRKEGVQHELF